MLESSDRAPQGATIPPKKRATHRPESARDSQQSRSRTSQPGASTRAPEDVPKSAVRLIAGR